MHIALPLNGSKTAGEIMERNIKPAPSESQPKVSSTYIGSVCGNLSVG